MSGFCDIVSPMRRHYCGFAVFCIIFATVIPDLSPADSSDIIEIRSKPLSGFDRSDSTRRRFGSLLYRGGLVLASSCEFFGGISAFRMQSDGVHFIALSDHGFWLRGRIVYDGERPTGIADAEMALVIDADGKHSGRLDTESLAEDDGILFAGLERTQSILRFDYGKYGFLAPGQPIEIPAEIKKWPFNQSLEGLVFVPKRYPLSGTLIALSECALDESGNLEAFLIGGPSPGKFTVKRTDEYDLTDADLLPGGDLLILERKYSPESGVAIRIRRIELKDIKPGALIDGPVVMEADKNFEIDNMEALSIHRAASGGTVLTLVSDDNFSPEQRTLLLQFILLPHMDP
jgi:hypothetical protein